MQTCSRRIRKHVEHVILWLRGILLDGEAALLLPVLLPFGLDGLKFKIAHGGAIYLSQRRYAEFTELVECAGLVNAVPIIEEPTLGKHSGCRKR